MSEPLIRVLPEAIANQIAAGEVIQRPASAVKELVENAVDAGARSVAIYLKDAGKTQIQIIDDGSGMSPEDARLAFSRHATSKIRKSEDLFGITTLGFRGEALASIASVAEVILQTRRDSDELGFRLEIAASEIKGEEPVSCAVGSNFCIKNLFFNLPARRKFLKTNQTELRHIQNEFFRIALSRPDIAFKLHHNVSEIYNLPSSGLAQRICHLFGKSISQQIIGIQADTRIVRVSGFVCKPEYAKKVPGEQFFFVNRRYIRHGLLHKAVMNAFHSLIPQDALPSYFIFLETDPENLDVNIHPTKTEVKFVDEQAVFQIIMASVKEALGKFNVIPSLDFEMDRSIEIPSYGSGTLITPPSIGIDPTYNPFVSEKTTTAGSFQNKSERFPKDAVSQWEALNQNFNDPSREKENVPADFESSTRLYESENLLISPEHHNLSIVQFKRKYIMTSSASGLMVIDQKRAHERILYEKFLKSLANLEIESQKLLYPKVMELSPADFSLLTEVSPVLQTLGFDIQPFGGYSISLNAYPAAIPDRDPEALFHELFSNLKDSEVGGFNLSEKIARSLSTVAAIPYGQVLKTEEMNYLIDQLFACESPGLSPTGKTVVTILRTEEIEKKF